MSNEEKFPLSIAEDLSHAVMSDESTSPIHGAYDHDLKPTTNWNLATLVVIGPYFNEARPDEPQYTNVDTTGFMNLSIH